MPKEFTLEEVRSWTPEKRLAIYQNAKKRPNGKYIVDLIDQNYLPMSSGALQLDDPVYRTMISLIWSEKGRQAAVQAVSDGYPAICGPDRLLQAELGDRYHKHDLGTATAGSIVAELMRHMGYREDGRGTCPPDCTAKTGMKWLPR